eukprot:CAMPEP_0205829740 /NCGR_PEP_ID=MMETSP0206-20130828/39081_1 /ASSEMBLY_ACC=CAM_ASM_000279 /TAXON_ID=36767 /ORGANISM="Euplotes focardii, Strain TN1" /LENGTH=82 /DNA_ID=CAMNT_0053132771 /DNA_START=74 /DNA_END=319 /DNA_ORIENTATION=+
MGTLDEARLDDEDFVSDCFGFGPVLLSQERSDPFGGGFPGELKLMGFSPFELAGVPEAPQLEPAWSVSMLGPDARLRDERIE